jgi:hypothetical protein
MLMENAHLDFQEVEIATAVTEYVIELIQEVGGQAVDVFSLSTFASRGKPDVDVFIYKHC